MFFGSSDNIFTLQKAQSFIRYYAKSDNWHNLDISTGNLGYGLIHYSIIRSNQYSKVLCIGSRYGYIPAICALACKDNHQGMVDFVDAGFDQTKNEPHHWGGMGMWKKINKDQYFQPFNLSPHLALHVTLSTNFAKANYQSTWDYIHIDGDHSYAGVKADYESFWPQLNSGGYMAFHDIYTSNLGDVEYGVHQFWQELKLKYSHAVEFPGPCGLGIIQKL